MVMKWKRWVCLIWVSLAPLIGHAVAPMISVSRDSSLFLNSDGSVWGTGNVIDYAPGATSPVPLLPLQLPNVVAVVTTGYGADFALQADGTLWGVGNNDHGQLGDGTTQRRSQPQRIPGVSGVKAFATGGFFFLAVKEDGTVWAWGDNDYGQLGDGTRIARLAPVQVRDLTNVTKVSAGNSSSLALRSDGTVWVWGWTWGGAAGNGLVPANDSDPEAAHLFPVQVHDLDQVVDIAAGEAHNMVLRADGTVWSWGGGAFGNNGTGREMMDRQQPLPMQIPGLESVVAIAKTWQSSFALKADGTVWAWGNNNFGQLGVSGIAYSAVPIQVPGLSDMVTIAAYFGHVLALKRDGTVFAWGTNDSGQLGDNTLQDRVQPLPVVGPGGSGQLNLVQPSPGRFNQLPLAQINLSVTSGTAPLTVQATAVNANDPDGSVQAYYWKSGDGQQATGSSVTFVYSRPGSYDIDLLIEDNAGGRGRSAQRVVIAPSVTAAIRATPKVAMVHTGSVALANDGRILTWGYSHGALGLYDQGRQNSLPTANSLPIANGVTGAMDIANGLEQVHVLLPDGTVLGWGGINARGEVGTGNSSSVSHPEVLANLSPVRALAEWAFSSFALTRDGRVFAWGENTLGELGLGDYQNRFQPTEIPGMKNVAVIAAGSLFAVAIKDDGTFWAWGPGSCGLQACDGTAASRNRPSQIFGIADVAKLYAVGGDLYVQKTDGTVHATSNSPLRPTSDTSGPGLQHVPALDNVAQIAGHNDFIIVRKADGTVWTAGLESSLALGFRERGDVSVLRQLPGISDAIWVAGGQYGAMVLRGDGTVLAWGLNNYGRIGDGTLALQRTPVLVLNEAGDGFLDLIPEVPNSIPQDKIPPFFLATYANGGLSSTTLYADVKGLTPSGAFASNDGSRFAAGYNVYVAASVPSVTASPYFQLDSNNHWSTLTWPMTQYLSGVALNSQTDQVRAQILQNADLSSPLFAGTSVLVGYGTDADEMLRAGRYRTIYTVTQP